jgi:hypothetical protein
MTLGSTVRPPRTLTDVEARALSLVGALNRHALGAAYTTGVSRFRRNHEATGEAPFGVVLTIVP